MTPPKPAKPVLMESTPNPDGTPVYIPLLDFEAESKRYVDALDRTGLGVFATPIPLLAAADVFYRMALLPSARSAITLRNEWYERLRGAFVRSCRKQSDMDDATAEMVFWWGLTDDPLWEQRKICTDNVAVSERLTTLISIHAHPDMHDYFAAGIWDVDFIERCISDGIDPEMAAVLVAGSKS